MTKKRRLGTRKTHVPGEFRQVGREEEEQGATAVAATTPRPDRIHSWQETTPKWTQFSDLGNDYRCVLGISMCTQQTFSCGK